ncbi:hypothetical protein D3C81_1932760 [compost metagenome]
MIRRQPVMHILLKLHNFVRQGRRFGAALLQCLSAPGQSSRCPADSKIYPSRRQRSQHIEIFRYLIRAVMLEHDAAGANADTLCLGKQMRDQHLRG